MPIQQNLTPLVLLFSVFAGWDYEALYVHTFDSVNLIFFTEDEILKLQSERDQKLQEVSKLNHYFQTTYKPLLTA